MTELSFKEVELVEKGWLEHVPTGFTYKQKRTLYRITSRGDAIPVKSYIVEEASIPFST